MKIIKNFLTSDELGFIIGQMNQQENPLLKEILKVGIVAQMCIDEFQEVDEDISCEDIYDKIVEDEEDILSLIETEIRNYSVIDKLANNSIYDLISASIDAINEKLNIAMNEINSEELKKVMEEFGQISAKA